MKKMLTLFIAVAVVSVTSMVAIAQNTGPADIKLEASMGDINFPHANHQEIVAECATCHHTGTDVASCKSCHDENPEAPKAKKVFHKLCKDCHKKESGPTKCKACHVK